MAKRRKGAGFDDEGQQVFSKADLQTMVALRVFSHGYNEIGKHYGIDGRTAMKLVAEGLTLFPEDGTDRTALIKELSSRVKLPPRKWPTMGSL
jgi:hypothetical protein